MALAPSLLPGYKYEIQSGLLAGEAVEIVDNTPFPDSDDRRRRITVKHDDGTIDYILPRLLGSTPVGTALEPTVVEVPVFVPAAPIADVTTETPEAPEQRFGVNTLAPNPITDPMDPRLDHLRPSRTKVRRYMNREMANGMTDVEFLLAFAGDKHRATNDGRPRNVALKGDTQAGKTFLVEALAVAWADAMGLPKPMPIFTLSGSSGVTDFDLFGQTTSYTDPMTGRESLVFLPGIVALAAQVGGILYLDEMNAMGERVTSSLHSLLDHRHQFVNRNKPVWKAGQFMPEVVTASLDLWIVATYNEGYRGMGMLNEAFAQRFTHLLWGYDKNVEAMLVKSPTIRLLADALRTLRDAKDIKTPVGTSALQQLKLDIDTFGVEMAIEIFIGMFQPNERKDVAGVIEDRSIIILLRDEVNQAAANAEAGGD